MNIRILLNKHHKKSSLTTRLLIETKIAFYINLKFTGKTNFTRTAFPFCLPGFHLGML